MRDIDLYSFVSIYRVGVTSVFTKNLDLMNFSHYDVFALLCFTVSFVSLMFLSGPTQIEVSDSPYLCHVEVKPPHTCINIKSTLIVLPLKSLDQHSY